MNERRKHNLALLLIALITCILAVSVVLLMNFVQGLLHSDVQINLTEIVTQNKDVITSKLMLEMNNLDMVAAQIGDRLTPEDTRDADALRRTASTFLKKEEDERVFVAAADGMAVFMGGEQLDISGRAYFRHSSTGTQTISERVVSRLNGEDIFVFSVPLEHNDKIVGTVQKWFTPNEIYTLCSVSLFSDQGTTYIINSQGYILVSSLDSTYNRESDNYFRMLFLDNPEASRKLSEDIKNNQAGFMDTVQNNRSYFSVYTPIDQIAYDWYLISSVATSAVSPNANIVFDMFYVVLLVVVLTFLILAVYFLRYKNHQQSNLMKLAFEDTVTGGATYTKFLVDLGSKLALPEQNEPSAIFAVDIDNFKYINNYYGFDFGDRMLRKLHDRFASLLQTGELICRTDGDHFVLLLADLEKNRLGMLFPPEIYLGDITIYISAGQYPISDPEESVNLMVDKANLAKRSIKGVRHKGLSLYTTDDDRKLIYNEQLKRSVEQALNDGEIVPFFQPKVDIRSGKLVGAEALARWKQKDGTLMPPSHFIPICEETQLIVSVDLAIFEGTLQFLQEKAKEGLVCVPISVNFSRQHQFDDTLLDQILTLLQRYQVPPNLVELEITETTILDNYQNMEDFIQKLHNHGLTISMDDFGSGYSSLNMLKDVDIDVLKIDRIFLKETIHSDRQRAIFTAIMQMADNLHIRVVVEGVENKDNVALMRECGGEVAQGFFYARPMDKEPFYHILKHGRIEPKE